MPTVVPTPEGGAEAAVIPQDSGTQVLDQAARGAQAVVTLRGWLERLGYQPLGERRGLWALLWMFGTLPVYGPATHGHTVRAEGPALVPPSLSTFPAHRRVPTHEHDMPNTALLRKDYSHVPYGIVTMGCLLKSGKAASVHAAHVTRHELCTLRPRLLGPTPTTADAVAVQAAVEGHDGPAPIETSMFGGHSRTAP